MKIQPLDIGGRICIEVSELLHQIAERDMLLLEKIAVPGLDSVKTEELRGRRAELLYLKQQLKENTNAARY